MLYLARNLSQLHFGSLMAVYADANRENGREAWPEEPEMRQIQLRTVRQRPALGAVPGRASAGSAGNRPGAAAKGLCRRADRGGADVSWGGREALFPRGQTKLAISENPRKMRLPPDCGRCRLCGRLGEPEGLHHVLGSMKTRKPPYDQSHTEVLLRVTYSPRSVVSPRGSSGCSQ